MQQSMPQPQAPTMEAIRGILDTAASAGTIADLYTSIGQAPDILDHIDGIHFIHTPVHIAASAGQTHFAKEILSMKPSLGQKLNPDGLSPLHLALKTLKEKKAIQVSQKNEELKLQTDKLTMTVKQLVKFDGELVRVRGRDMLTPLHLVAQEGEIDLLLLFLRACPASIWDVTVRDETALHIAVKNSRIRAFEKLLGWLQKNIKYRAVLNRGDEEGNTVLHIAASKSQPKIVDLLVKELSVKERYKKNDMNSTALDIARELGPPNEAAKAQIMKALRSLPSRQVTYAVRTLLKTELSMEMRNIILVVAVLIATATYQAVLIPPGGGILDNKNLPTDQNGSDHIINGTISTINLLPGNNNITTPSSATIFLTGTSTATTNTTTNLMKRVLFMAPTGKRITVGFYFSCFYILNTVTFVSSIVVMIVVLPWHLITLLLHLTLIFLTFSYGWTILIIVPSHRFVWALMASSYMFVASVYFVYLCRFLHIDEIVKFLLYHTESIRN